MAVERLGRDEAIRLVERIMNGSCASDDELNECVLRLERDLVCPHVSEYIFWPKTPMTPTEVVDKALAYQPIALGPA